MPLPCKPADRDTQLHLQVLEHHADKDAFCKYNDPLLQLFVSVLFLAGIIGAFLGSFTSKRWGRRPTMMLGGLFFLIGAILMAPAVHVAMLIIGRVAMGLGELQGGCYESNYLPNVCNGSHCSLLLCLNCWKQCALCCC